MNEKFARAFHMHILLSNNAIFTDPHFVTWYGSHYSYHGACELILVQNPTFSAGKGLDIHVRTSHMMNGAFSFISNAALRIGKDVFEVVNHPLGGVKAQIVRVLVKVAKLNGGTNFDGAFIWLN